MADPDSPSALWLVRHGESAGNVARDRAHAALAERVEIEAARDMDVPLSALGERQAAALGRWIARLRADEKPETVLASPYLRARRTAEIVAAEARIHGLVIDERLREREFGVFDRLTRRGIEKLFPAEAAQRKAVGKFYFRPPGGESWCDLLLRLRSVGETLAREHRGRRVLIVGHSAVVLCFRYLLERMTEEQILAIDAAVDIANCSITSYEMAGGKPELRRFNFVAPLEEQGAKVTTEPDAPILPK
jgi:broad specificity phosphatase PhoE